ncbi:MAG: Smr/MutS family protein, partial [Azospirillaceae bacterium]
GRGTFTGGKAVLKSKLADWLNDPPLRDKVLAFYPAQPRHGGEGAFYVLLKRLRD